MTVGSDLFQMAFLSNIGSGGDGDDCPWKNDCADVITSDCGGDMTHCYVAFTETDALLGKRGSGDAAHWNNDCAEVIASDCGGEMTHCYAAFTETDALLGGCGGGDAAHWNNDCAEVIASDCGGEMTHCFAAFTETDALLGGCGGGDVAHCNNDCAEVIASDCGGEMTHCFTAAAKEDSFLENESAEVIASDCGGDVTRCYDALAETDAVLRDRRGCDETPSKTARSEVGTSACGAHMTHCSDARRGHDPALWKNIRAGTSACGVRDHATFMEINHSRRKLVSSRMSDSPENSASWSLNTSMEGRRDEWGLCFALLQTASAVMEDALGHDSGMIPPEIISSCSAGTADAVGSTKRVTALLNAALGQLLELSALSLTHHLPTDCGASALRSHAQSPGSVAALGSQP